MEYISVKDRLPKESGIYLTKMIVGSVITKIVKNNRVMFKLNGGRWCAGDWKIVTHWKELPIVEE